MYDDINKTTKASPYQDSCSADIDWVARVELQAAAQKNIDHAISSTLNLPEDVTIEEVDKIYRAAWKAGLKGVTIYRDNCRTGVLVKDTKERPKELACEVHHTIVKGKSYFVLVGMKDGKPYEVFSGKNGFIDASVKTGKIVRQKKHFKAIFDDGEELSPITSSCSEIEEVVTRLISTSLRHGVDLNYTVTQLEKIPGEIHGFGKAIARILKKYIKDGTRIDGEKCENCGTESLIRKDGCWCCSTCGTSKCS